MSLFFLSTTVLKVTTLFLNEYIKYKCKHIIWDLPASISMEKVTDNLWVVLNKLDKGGNLHSKRHEANINLQIISNQSGKKSMCTMKCNTDPFSTKLVCF